MRKYEAIVVFTTTIGDSELQEEIQKVQALLEANGAHDLSVEKWGRKEIAYIVKRQRFGNFVSFHFVSSESGLISKLSGILRITDSVLKFQTHRIAEKQRKFKGNPKAKRVDIEDGDDSMLVELDY